MTRVATRGGVHDVGYGGRYSQLLVSHPAFSINLIGLIIIVLIAFAANAVTERLTSNKAGGLFTAVIITLIGSYLFAVFVRFPFDFELEGVRIIAALLGAIIIAVFYTLIRGQAKKK